MAQPKYIRCFWGRLSQCFHPKTMAAAISP